MKTCLLIGKQHFQILNASWLCLPRCLRPECAMIASWMILISIFLAVDEGICLIWGITKLKRFRHIEFHCVYIVLYKWYYFSYHDVEMLENQKILVRNLFAYSVLCLAQAAKVSLISPGTFCNGPVAFLLYSFFI